MTKYELSQIMHFCSHLLFLLFIFSLVCFISCRQENVQQFLFLGHIYAWNTDGKRVDPRVERIDFSEYDQIWLGGDVCGKTTEEETTIIYLDSLFDLADGRVHWALGNHDVKYGNLPFITNRTLRPDFYADFSNKLALLVLNTDLFSWPAEPLKEDVCEAMQTQYELLRNIADTIQQASHLVILHHYGLLTQSLTLEEIDPDTVFNFYHPEYWVRCHPPGTFENAIYPLLKKIQARGVQVVLVSGDFGMKKKEFEFQTEDGIWFLGSGINNSGGREHLPLYVTSAAPDKVLIFHYAPASQELSWQFVLLNELAGLPPE